MLSAIYQRSTEVRIALTASRTQGAGRDACFILYSRLVQVPVFFFTVFFTQKIESEISDEAGKKIENFRLVVIKIVVNWVLRVEEDGVCVFVRACVSFGRCLDVHIVSCRPVSLPISFIMVAVVAVVVAITVPVPSH